MPSESFSKINNICKCPCTLHVPRPPLPSHSAEKDWGYVQILITIHTSRSRGTSPPCRRDSGTPKTRREQYVRPVQCSFPSSNARLLSQIKIAYICYCAHAKTLSKNAFVSSCSGNKKHDTLYTLFVRFTSSTYDRAKRRCQLLLPQRFSDEHSTFSWILMITAHL